jgi:hypothetical protein
MKIMENDSPKDGVKNTYDIHLQHHSCRNLSLGLTTKARVCKVASQEGSPGITSRAPESAKECEGMNLHTPSELSFWEL